MLTIINTKSYSVYAYRINNRQFGTPIRHHGTHVKFCQNGGTILNTMVTT